MAEQVREFHSAEQSLNTVGAGLSLAHQVVDALRRGESVHVDLTAAERMTPSFANALVMTILEAVGEGAFRARVSMSHSSDLVAQAWSKAVERYGRGIRLSTQQPGAAQAGLGAAGCPFSFTIDEDTLKDHTVTVRDRDTGAQERIALDRVTGYVGERLAT